MFFPFNLTKHGESGVGEPEGAGFLGGGFSQNIFDKSISDALNLNHGARAPQPSRRREVFCGPCELPELRSDSPVAEWRYLLHLR